MLIEKKTYRKGQAVTSGQGNPEMIFLLIKEKDILYAPEYAKEYSFDEDTELFEIVLDPDKKEFIRPENMASPFLLCGDACFYKFLTRKINISGQEDFYKKKGRDLLWKLEGNLNLVEEDGSQTEIDDWPLVFAKNDVNYSLKGQGQVFLIKL